MAVSELSDLVGGQAPPGPSAAWVAASAMVAASGKVGAQGWVDSTEHQVSKGAVGRLDSAESMAAATVVVVTVAAATVVVVTVAAATAVVATAAVMAAVMAAATVMTTAVVIATGTRRCRFRHRRRCRFRHRLKAAQGHRHRLLHRSLAVATWATAWHCRPARLPHRQAYAQKS